MCPVSFLSMVLFFLGSPSYILIFLLFFGPKVCKFIKGLWSQYFLSATLLESYVCSKALYCQCYTFLGFYVPIFLCSKGSIFLSPYIFKAMCSSYLFYQQIKQFNCPDLVCMIQCSTNVWMEFKLTQWLTRGHWNPQRISAAVSGMPCYRAEGHCFRSYHWNTHISPISKQKTSRTWCHRCRQEWLVGARFCGLSTCYELPEIP